MQAVHTRSHMNEAQRQTTTAQPDYFGAWSTQDAGYGNFISEPDCCTFESIFCCNDYCPDVRACFEEMCQEHPCNDTHQQASALACFEEHCQEAPCPDSHGGRLRSAEPCFTAHDQYLPPCTDPTCALDTIDSDTASAATQLTALTRAGRNINPSYSSVNDFDSVLNEFTNHNAPSSKSGHDSTPHDSGISGLSRSNTTCLSESEDDSGDEVSTATGKRSKKQGTNTFRHQPICSWTDPKTNRLCGQCFVNASDLHTHVDKDHIDKLEKDDSGRFRCQWAGCKRLDDQTFTAKPKLKRHVQTHTHYKPYQCQYCNTNMKTKDALEKHTRIHTGEAPYTCAECKKTFKTSTEHKTHMTAVHSNQKPHECPHCGQRFADSSNLSKHKKTHWMGSYKCLHPGCKAHMKRWDQIRRHFQTQSHCPELLLDGSEAQRKYKREMQDNWLAIPEEDRLILDKAPVKKEKMGLPTPAASRDQTMEVEEKRSDSWTDVHEGDGLLLLSAATEQASPLKRKAIEAPLSSNKRVMLDPHLNVASRAPAVYDPIFDL